MQNLRTKVLNLFDVYFSDEVSNAEILKELNRRGKFDQAKIMATLFMLIEEIEALKAPKADK